MPRKPPRPDSPIPVNIGADYTEEELELLRAIDRYRAANHRKFVTFCEVLKIMRSLGYRKEK